MSFLIFILVFIPIVFVHEIGHWIIGLLLGAKPKEFSIGFGKDLIHFTAFKTKFKICLIPLGGYVQFENYQFSNEKRENHDHIKLSPLRWIAISLAGPFANFLFTFMIFFSLSFMALSTFEISKESNETLFNLKRSNLLTDKVISKEVFDKNFVSYDGVTITKVLKSEVKSIVFSELSYLDKLVFSSKLSFLSISYMTRETFKAFGKILSPTRYGDKKDESSIKGPLGMMKIAGESGQKGWIDVVVLIASLSFGLGFFNLLPLSILDGGRALLGAYEAISVKEINHNVMNFFHKISTIFVFSLIVFATISDLNIF